MLAANKLPMNIITSIFNVTGDAVCIWSIVVNRAWKKKADYNEERDGVTYVRFIDLR